MMQLLCLQMRLGDLGIYKLAGCGWHYMDPYTCIQEQGSSTEAHGVSPLMAEAIAVQETLLQTKSRQLSKICLKSDNQVLINALISNQSPVDLHIINLDIENLTSSFVLLNFSYVFRSLNCIADALAKSALYGLNSSLPP